MDLAGILLLRSVGHSLLPAVVASIAVLPPEATTTGQMDKINVSVWDTLGVFIYLYSSAQLN